MNNTYPDLLFFSSSARIYLKKHKVFMGARCANKNNVTSDNLRIFILKGLGGNHLAGIGGSEIHLRDVLAMHAHRFLGACVSFRKSLRREA